MNMVLRKRKTNTPPAKVEYKDIPFTKERHDKLTEADIEVGGDDRTGKRYRIKDMAEKLRDDKRIDGRQYAALYKYKHHWYHGGLQSNLKSPDLNRVFASDAGNMSGLAKNEWEAHHRDQYHKAKHLLLKQGRLAEIVENIVLYDFPLDRAGNTGWKTLSQSRTAATEMLRFGGNILAEHWGIG